MEIANCPFVSVVVPVFNDSERLRGCLDSLNQQTYPRDRYEVVVVDNGSDGWEEVRAVATSFENVVFAREPCPGSYAARNKGLSLAKGDIIAFTDADCVPAFDWLERGVAHLQRRPACGQVVGRVELFCADPANPTPVELYERLTAFPQEKLLERFHGGATANVFTRRQVLEQVGPFNAALKSNGDLEWGERVFHAGFEQIYASDTLVKHPARRSFRELHRRTVRLAGGVYERLVKSKHSFLQRQKMFARLMLDDLTPPVNFVIDTFRSSELDRWQHKLAASSVIFYVRCISAWEKLRLQLGGISERG